MPRFRDVRGRVFGRLTVLSHQGTGAHGHALWLCRCSCGREVVLSSGGMVRGTTRSCGCLQRELLPRLHLKHGHARGRGQATREYRIWTGMIVRCTNPKATSYAKYGGRGITVCQAWRNSFEAFLADVGPRPSPRHSLDRIDGSRGYEPGNVRWATGEEQSQNRPGMTKVGEQQVQEIRRRYAAGESLRQIGAAFGLGKSQVSRIVRRICWSNVGEDALAGTVA